MELTAYSAIIDQLKPLVAEPDFEDMLARLTRSESPSARFLIKMELKRLASPCVRVIDLRGRVNGNCHPFEHDGRLHYLDDMAVQSFKRSVKDYRGVYTMGVYEDVMNTENNFRVLHRKQQEQQLSELQSSSKKSAEDEALLLANRKVPHYPGKLVQFGRYVLRSEERMHYAISIEVTLADGVVIEGNTTDLSVSGARIKVDDSFEIPKGDHILVKLMGLEDDYVLGEMGKGIEYVVMGSDEHLNGQQRLRLMRANNEPVFDEFLERLIRGNKRRYKVNLDHAVDAVLCKGYEQYFFPRMCALPVFCSGKRDEALTPELALVTENNRHIIHYWRDEEYRLQLDGVLQPARLNRLREAPQDPLLIYCFTHSARGKLFYYSAIESEFESEQQKQVFMGFGANKPSWQVLQLTIAGIHPAHANLTTLKDGREGPELDQQSPPPRVEGRLKDVRQVVLISDVTSEIGVQRYASNEWDKSQVNILKALGHKRGGKSAIELHALSFSNLRRETRFAYKTQVICKLGEKAFEGFTRDISSAGLQVELDEPIPCEVGDAIHLALPQLQKLTKKIRLEELAYEIVGHNATDTVLHLKLKTELGSQEAKRFLSQVIESNRKKLPALRSPQVVDGMSNALRNISAHAVTTTPFYVHKRGARYAIDTVAASEHFSPVCELLQRIADKEHKSGINLYPLVKAEHFHEHLLVPLKKLEREDPPITLELYIRLQTDSDGIPTFAQCRYADEFENEIKRRMFILDSLNQGEFFAWQVHLSRTGRPDIEFVNDELSYISQYAIHKAKKLEMELWDVVGVGELVDVTKEVLCRYPTINKK
ncbi:PilZ domain-containing protein [Corallincola holothuriorum]|uniref:PilZ domain-containing protein n=1 Tax=Corallincola holothuriorum TaxID=2282215 RepID=A0A368N3W1_9GAMM|nr:PilZ domain-containing protein [Corallincola holothuriorum]RCU45222.1 PilZ domain-containing protein [Corallincola holothuriorum]